MRWRLVAAAAITVAAYRPALAADLPTPSLPPPLSVAVYNWTGIYLGINGGFGTGNSNWSDGPIGTTGSFPTSGFLIGGTAGINYQIGKYVFGIEGDGDWTNLHGNSAKRSVPRFFLCLAAPLRRSVGGLLCLRLVAAGRRSHGDHHHRGIATAPFRTDK